MKPQIYGLRKRKIPVAWDLAGGYQKPISKVSPSMKIRLERALRRWMGMGCRLACDRHGWGSVGF